MEGNLSQHIYGGAKSFRDIGYDNKVNPNPVAAASNPRGNPVGYAPILATGDPITTENEYSEDWDLAISFSETLSTGRVHSAHVHPSYYPNAVFWPTYQPSPSPGGPVPYGPGPSPAAIRTPTFPFLNLPCIKVPTTNR
jgi:hypothetical protein